MVDENKTKRVVGVKDSGDFLIWIRFRFFEMQE